MGRANAKTNRVFAQLDGLEIGHHVDRLAPAFAFDRQRSSVPGVVPQPAATCCRRSSGDGELISHAANAGFPLALSERLHLGNDQAGRSQGGKPRLDFRGVQPAATSSSSITSSRPSIPRANADGKLIFGLG